MLTVFVRTNWKYQAAIYKKLLTIEKKKIQKNRGWIPGGYADPVIQESMLIILHLGHPSCLFCIKNAMINHEWGKDVLWLRQMEHLRKIGIVRYKQLEDFMSNIILQIDTVKPV